MKFYFDHLKVFKYSIKLLLVSTILLKFNFAGNNNIRFEHLGLEDGLSQVSVFCILQDDQGFMWFGTQDGLNKYDGYKFTVYRHNPDDSASLSNNYVWSIYEDAGGNLWIGTRGGGLNKFDRKTEKFIRYQNQANNSQSLSNNSVFSIFEDAGSVLWIGTYGGGLNKFDRKTEKFIRYQNQADNPQSLSNNYVVSIFEDAGGNLWIGTLDGGLNKFDRKTEKFIRYQNQANNSQSLSNNSVFSIFEDAGSVLWIGTLGGGLNKFDRKTEKFIRYQNQADNPQSLSNNYVVSIFEDAGGALWIGTRGGGLNKFDRKAEKFIHYQNQPDNPQSLNNNYILSIYEDAGGNLWIGTSGEGLNKFDRKTEKFIRYQNQPDNPQSLSDNSVWSIFEDAGGNLWIGTRGGLNKLDRKGEKFTCYQNQPDNPQSLSHNSVRSIFEDAGSSLWIGTYEGGLNKLDRKTGKFTSYQNQPDNPQSLSHNSVWSIFEDTGGNLWIGTSGGGLNKFNRKTKKFTCYQNQPDNPQSLSHNSVLSIFEDVGGNLWIGTNGGLNKFDRKEEKFIRYQNQPDNPQSLSNNYVRSIFEDTVGNLWIGTRGGINKFDRKEEKFTRYREKDGLPNDVVYGILGDDNDNLWLSTNKGISKFNPQTETFTNYDEKDGLQDDEFNTGAFHQGGTGRMYFGGVNGFNEFYPDSINDNTYIPPVVITDFLLFNKSVHVSDTTVLKHNISFTKEIILDYIDYIFAFTFSALNYRQPEKNQFLYKLEGFNEDWMETNYKHRRATYTNLSPGEYIFRVKASNDDGYWNKKGTSIKVIILPPPWKAWWAYSIYTLALLGLIFWFIQSQRNKVKRKQRELKRLQAIYDNTTSVMYMKDLKGRYIMVNRRFEELNNISREEIFNKTPYDIFPLETAAAFVASDREVLKKNRPLEFEEQVMHEDGQHTFISVRFPLWGTDNKPYAICGISTDITERKLAEEEMSHLRNLLSNIINSMPSALVGVDIEGRVTQWNNGAEKATGIKADTARGRLINEVFPNLQVQMSNIRKAIEERQIQRNLKVKQERQEGTSFCDIVIFPLVTNGVEGAVIRVDDITERVRLEEMMIQSEKMMSIGGLAAGMAHEINNPLAGIMQNLQVINNRLSENIPKNIQTAEKYDISMDNLLGYLNERQVLDMIKNVREASQRAAKIVENMLSFSRKSESKFTPYDIPELLDKTVELATNDYDLKRKYDFRQIKIVREYEDNLPQVPCDGSKIQQVFLNILKNSAQAMADEKDKRLKKKEKINEPKFILRIKTENDMAYIEIEDNGPGMDDKTKKRVFEPFFTTKKVGMGTGLGLSVSYFIITENHNGNMTVESTVGKGTKFIIHLPVKRE